MDPITISLSPQQAALALIVVLTALVLGILMLMGRKGAIAPATGWLIPTAQALSVVMFGFAIVAASYLLWSVIAPPADPASPAPGLGAGAVIVALLGAPFLIWRTVIAQKTVDFQKEGHITDRIAKAVEQLGAEKKVDRIGRPVTLWTGQPTEEEIFYGKADTVVLPTRCLEISRRWETRMASPSPLSSSVEEGALVRVQRWPTTETRIEWQGKPPPVVEGEYIAHTGEWQTFSESLPNIEVRIGGILSLERIAQDSTAYDNGRDHVPIMEILCAYIRENAPASGAQDHPFGEWAQFKENARAWSELLQVNDREERFGGNVFLGKVHRWAQNLKRPRQDVTIALEVIGRRSAAQRNAEARSRTETHSTEKWPFSEAPQRLPLLDLYPLSVLDAHEAYLNDWQDRLKRFRGFHVDLRIANIQGCKLPALDLSASHLSQVRLDGAALHSFWCMRSNLRAAHLNGAILAQAQLGGTNFSEAHLEGAILIGAELQRAHFGNAKLNGASLSHADLSFANLSEADLEAAHLFQTLLVGANLQDCSFAGANLGSARLDGAKLWGSTFDKTTKLINAKFFGAAFANVDLSSVSINQEQISQAFGDDTVILPDDLHRPEHWPRRLLVPGDFKIEWRKWQADPASYTPPPSPG